MNVKSKEASAAMRFNGNNGDSLQPSDDSIQGEIAYLETLFVRRPALAPIVLNRLGELGLEGRADLARLRSQRSVRLKPQVIRARRQSSSRRISGRVAAAVALIVTGPSLVGVLPAVAVEAPAAVTQEANLPKLELRVMDRASGVPLSGVRLQTAEDELVAITDTNGRAEIPAKYASEPVITLEREGYPMVLIEGAKLSNRSLITMKHFSGGAMASLPSGLSQNTESLAPKLAVHPAPTQVAAAPVVAPADPLAATLPATAKSAPIRVATTPVAEPKLAPPMLKPIGANNKPSAVAAKPITSDNKPVAAPAPLVAPTVVAHAPVATPAKATPFVPVTVAIRPPASRALPPKPIVGAAKPAPVAPTMVAARQAEPASTHVFAPAPIRENMPKFAPPVAMATQPQEVPPSGVKAVTAAQVAHVPVGTASVMVRLPVRPVKAMPIVGARAPQVASAPTRDYPITSSKPVAADKPVNPMAYASIVLPTSPRPARGQSHQAAGSFRTPQLAQMASSGSHATNYTVRAGDMLSSIAARELGSATRWSEIYYANRDKLTDTRWLKVGMVLAIPKGSAFAVAGGAPGHTYLVRPGDSLSKIAKEQLGDISKWRQLYAFNRHIVHDPWMIFPGQRLNLPGTMSASAPGIAAWANMRALETPPG